MPRPIKQSTPDPHEQVLALRAPDGARLHYRRVAGSGSGTVLCVHGLGSNLTRFGEFLQHTQLRPGFTTVRVDLRGHGRSPWGGPLCLEQWCDDLGAILRAHGDQPALVVGHSLGAVVALHLARREPALVAGLVLIEPTVRASLRHRSRLLVHARPLARAAARIARGLDRLGLGRRRYVYRNLQVWDRLVRRRLLDRGQSAAMTRLYDSWRVDLRYNPAATLLADLGELLRPLPDLEHIHQPTLLLRAASGPDTAPELAALPDLRVRTLPGTHWLLTESPQLTRAAIDEFCLTHARPGTGAPATSRS